MQGMKAILLVEDNPDDQELTKLALAKCNIANDIVIAGDGVEALDYLFATGPYENRADQAMPAVVLLDLKLPRIDGIGVLQRMREDPRTALLPVVMLTSSREQEDIVKSYKLGANSYIRKPVDFEQFTKAVAQLGLYWLLLNEVAY